MFLLNLSVTFFLIYGSSLYTLDVISPLLVKCVADNCPSTSCFLMVPFKEQKFLKFNIIKYCFFILQLTLFKLCFGNLFLPQSQKILFWKIIFWKFVRQRSNLFPSSFFPSVWISVDQDHFFKTLSFPSAVLPLPQIIYPCM